MGFHLIPVLICEECEVELRADARWTTEYGRKRLVLTAAQRGWRYDEAEDEATCAACLAKETGANS